ncbi:MULTISPECIES: hypothetical protein [Metabacillus]|uniref:hypothetical protein n=1 Tax=Metabacillus TaxID=2675233 RepID=UPI000C808688|nr:MULTISPECIES: hypothetical protein [Metabacillus]MCM3443602.1 hypothetical protein [Metabacillus halosaccharovorans]PMC34238.1 hypothetical protein CJ195_24280 [Bacillus sp. UMB0899]
MSQMDIYEHQSYITSISNLAMLKLFHDAGVNVKEKIHVKKFMVHVEQADGSELDIFHDGLKELFEVVERYDYGDELPSQYSDIYISEYAIIIKDAVIATVLQSQSSFSKELEHAVKSVPQHVGNYLHVEADTVILPDQTGFVINIHCPGMLHSLTENILHLRKLAEDYANKLISESAHNGISNKTNGQTA